MFYAVRATAPTRAPSPRQLPTDHDYAVPTREYQSDQSSRLLLRCHPPAVQNPKPKALKAHQRERVPPYARPSILVDTRTVLAVKGSLRRAKLRRALDGSAPFQPDDDRDGRLRREHSTARGKNKGRRSSRWSERRPRSKHRPTRGGLTGSLHIKTAADPLPFDGR